MGDLNVRIGNLGPAGTASRTFEANSQPLETTTAWINFDESNDFSVPLRFGSGEDAQTVFLRPDQVDAMKMALAGASRNEAISDGSASVSVTVNGQSYTMSARDMQSQLSGRGALTAGS
ncbi:MAG: hypothetical protein CVV27_18685 [Candidatus Melainabacteria bacterium HGW-Melainabacteria-1]|nr:MAG: hypothetical protein CVV27_18685 [Candidatus Melainabacteria bacterium HGW-Melainabacteria-1]